MSLQSRLSDLITAVGADIAALRGRQPPNGGTTGQVLKKTSNADGAYSWQNESGGGGGTAIHVGTTPPADPVEGQLWVDTN